MVLLGYLKIRSTTNNSLIVDAIISGTGTTSSGSIDSVVSVGGVDNMWATDGRAGAASGNSIWQVNNGTSTGFNIVNTNLRTYLGTNMSIYLIFYNSGTSSYLIQSNYTGGTPFLNPVTKAYSVEITVASDLCMLSSSLINTSKGLVPIKDLTLSHLILTVEGEYRSLHAIGKMDIVHSKEEPVLYAYQNDLVLTKNHCILLPNFESDEQQDKVIDYMKYMHITQGLLRIPVCFALDAKEYEEYGEYTVYNIALESDDPDINFGIYANSVLVETCQKSIIKKMELIHCIND